MIKSNQNAAFRRDKHHFFSQIAFEKSIGSNIQLIEPLIDLRVAKTDYAFLLNNQMLIETEFTEMFTILQNQDDDKKEIFWLYCYYLASLLENFHRAYSQTSKAEEYEKIKQQIKDRLAQQKKQDESEDSFIASLYNSFIDGLRRLANAPFHVSHIRDYVAFTNLCRIYWVFCRLTLVEGLALARDVKIIDKLDALLGTHTDVDKIIATLKAPTAVINYFSVGLFLARFMIDGGLLLKHTFFPTELEKGEENSCELNYLNSLPGAASIEAYRRSYIMVQEQVDGEFTLYYIPKEGPVLKLAIKDKEVLQKALLQKLNKEQSIRLTSAEIKELITAQTTHIPEFITRFDRFKHELYKRHCNFANDLVWGTVNFLTNFNSVVGISGPVASYITSAFLVFDVCLLLYRCNLAEQEYLLKKSQYLQEIEDYNDSKNMQQFSAEQKLAHIEMLQKQLNELEINWRTKQATFYFLASAAALLMAGFTVAVLVNPPLLIVACFFVSTIAVAMYLSSGAYSQYKEKSLYLEQAQLNGNNIAVALKEYETARNHFIFTMVKNTVVPMVLIATFAVCWPAAVILTALYIGAELFHAYNQHQNANAIKQQALAAPEEEPVESIEFSPA